MSQLTARRARVFAVATFALLAALALSCGGDDSDDASAQQPATADSSVAAPTAAATAPFSTPRAPRMLPVTPVSIEYVVADPSFVALSGATAYSGEYEGGSYQIEVPAQWNGDVVYYAHGFRGNPPDLTVHGPPIRDYLIEQGYAWAASSYTKNGYEPGAGARDTFALREQFASVAGEPRREYLYGQSMGGHVATLSLEQYPDAYDGVFTECGVVSGHEILDYFLSWGSLAGYFSGVELYDSLTDAQTFGTKLSGEVVPALGPLDEPTEAGRAFANVVQHLTGGPRPYFREGYDANYGFNFGVLVNAVSTAGPANAAASNADTRYTIDDGFGFTIGEINSGVPRASANETFRDPAAYPEFADMSGAITRPVISLHNTGDLFVPISLEQSYRATVDAAGAGDLLVQRAIRRSGHCNFTEAERRQAFDDLVAWVEGGPAPRGDDFTAPLLDAGREWTLPLEPDDPGGVQ